MEKYEIKLPDGKRSQESSMEIEDMDCEEYQIDKEAFEKWNEENVKDTKLYLVESRFKPGKFYFYIYSEYDIENRPSNLLNLDEVEGIEKTFYYKSYKSNPVC